MAKVPILKQTVTNPKKKAVVENKDYFSDNNADLPDDLIYPLMPNDPAAGIVESQGHYLVHLGFFIGITCFLELQDEYSFCFTQTSVDNYTWKMSKVENNINQFIRTLQWMHLIIAVF